MSDETNVKPALGLAPPPDESTPGTQEARSILDLPAPQIPPHFWVSGWDFEKMPIPPGQAISAALSISQPKPPIPHFLAMSNLEHGYYLRMNRCQVWEMAIDLLKQVKMDPNSFVIEARKLAKQELLIL